MESVQCVPTVSWRNEGVLSENMLKLNSQFWPPDVSQSFLETDNQDLSLSQKKNECDIGCCVTCRKENSAKSVLCKKKINLHKLQLLHSKLN